MIDWDLILSIGVFILMFIVVIGMIRVLISPWRGWTNCFIEILLLDWLGDILGGLFDILGEIDFDD